MKVRIYKHYWIYLLISLIMLCISAWSLLTYGLNLGLDFTGGSLLEVKINQQLLNSEASVSAIATSSPEASAAPQLSEAQLRDTFFEHYAISSIQSTEGEQFIIRGEQIDNSRQIELLALLRERISSAVEIVRFESIGPTMGRELLQKTLTGILIVALVLVFYLRTQFKEMRYGVCALLGVIHDTFILLGIFSLLGHYYNVEVDSMFVTALLTTISFSVHDTIVMYDRIRELRKQFRHASYIELVEAGVLQTMTRSFNNSMTVVFMLSALVLMGGASIHWFAVALLVGVILGTYSSPFVSIPLLLLWEDTSQARLKKKKLKSTL